MLERAHLILFVADQGASRRFYGTVLSSDPQLDVPGMTEFGLPGGSVLGLMPTEGARRIVPAAFADVEAASPRCELYLVVDEPVRYLAAAIVAGAREVSPLRLREWGHEVGYCTDPDGHIVAFARIATSR